MGLDYSVQQLLFARRQLFAIMRKLSSQGVVLVWMLVDPVRVSYRYYGEFSVGASSWSGCRSIASGGDVILQYCCAHNICHRVRILIFEVCGNN